MANIEHSYAFEIDTIRTERDPKRDIIAVPDLSIHVLFQPRPSR